MRARSVLGVVAAAIALWLLFNTVLVLPEGRMAVIFNTMTGRLSSRNEGIHFLIPVIEKSILYDVRVQTCVLGGQTDLLECRTKDGQTVKLEASVRYHIDRQKITSLHQHIGVDYKEKIVRPELRTVIRQTISGYTLAEVGFRMETEIQNAAFESMKPALSANDLILDELSIHNVRFMPDAKSP